MSVVIVGCFLCAALLTDLYYVYMCVTVLVYVCACVYVCVWERERETSGKICGSVINHHCYLYIVEKKTTFLLKAHFTVRQPDFDKEGGAVQASMHVLVFDVEQ